MRRLFYFWKLARPHQYVKNTFIFLGPIFAEVWSLDLAFRLILAFASFSAMASAVYVCNDIFDVEADRNHPVKCERAIASGAMSIASCWRFAAGLAAVSLILASFVSLWALAIIAAYAAIQFGYSVAWKHVVVVDVILISMGFMLRILMGTAGLGIPPSSWLLLCGLMVTLFLGFAKRRSELMLYEKNTSAEV
ncbi:UbiA prenyltransferase family protein, partial [Rhodoblastus sp.]|uniref:UbiA prenyltransferase family protein n=1 Tax=Rhodoblastus sp. TaxID=1962975 RepID=UPI003F978D18